MHNIYNVDYHVTDRCNLKCASCGHFANLVNSNDESTDRTIEQANEDLTLLYNITNNGLYLDHLTITGGECSLNKNLINILQIAISLFPNKVTLYTNVINKNLYTNELMTFIEQNNISFECTLYYQKSEDIINELVEQYPNIHYVCYGNKENTTFFTSVFTKDRIKNIDKGYCNSKFTCIQLKDKKIYPCQYCGYMNYFFNKFGNHWKDILEFNDNEVFIDLEIINSYEELYEYLDKFDYTNDFCKHCIDKWRSSLQYGGEMLRDYHQITNENINEYIQDSIEDVLYKTYCNNTLTKKILIDSSYNRLNLI